MMGLSSLLSRFFKREEPQQVPTSTPGNLPKTYSAAHRAALDAFLDNARLMQKKKHCNVHNHSA